MTELWFSRAKLATDASLAAIMPLLEGRDARLSGHALIWSLFADGPERKRDFLWRENADGTYFMLSQRPPNDPHHLFALDEPKLFAPKLAAGDRLRFSLRANPVVRRKKEEKVRKHDVVMDALRGVPAGERAGPRKQIIEGAGAAWLTRQAEKCGFEVGSVSVDGYETVKVGRRGDGKIEFSVLDFEGVLTVANPETFLLSLAKGFGSAKAFGCGLMLIRRA